MGPWGMKSPPRDLGLTVHDIVTLVPNKEKFPRRCGQEDHAMKLERAMEGMAQPNEDEI